MQLRKISLNHLLFFLICICLIVFSINYSIFLSFRLLDIVFLCLFLIFLIYNPKVNKLLLLFVLFIFTILFISNSVGIFTSNAIIIERVVFFYKYLFIFSTPWIIVSTVKTYNQIRIINKILLINFIFLSSWTYIYLYLLVKGIISGNLRPSFPLSNDYMYSDAHLYSAYLGFFIVAYVFYFRIFFTHSVVVSLIIILNGIVGLILTGSRTGLVLVGLSFLFYGLYYIIKFLSMKNKLSIRKKTIVYFVVSLLFIIFLLLFIMPYINEFISKYENLIERAFNFDFASDQSSLGRIYKLIIAIEDVEYSGLLLGVGFNSSLIWYDGLFAILLAHGGLLFIFSIFVFYYLIVKKVALNSVNQKEFLLFLLLIVLYLVANTITEYIFVSRNAFPVLINLSVLYITILNENKSKEVKNE